MRRMERVVSLVLVDRGGRVLGALPAFAVAVPWWQEVAPVVEGARARFGVDVTVLRLLDAERAEPHGGAVTYLAEVSGPVDGLEPWAGALYEDPLRASWARPGGPAADLAWADEALARRDLVRAGPARQMLAWNLSSVWRVPLGDGGAWLKVVPPFFAFEGALLERLAGQAVPRVLATEGPRVLMEEVPGEDLHEPDLDTKVAMVRLLVGLQAVVAGDLEPLRALGLPAWDADALGRAGYDVLSRDGGGLEPGERLAVDALLAGLPERLATVAECGVPDSLVHGDFHPGNLRRDGDRLTLLDWGDAGVGCPLLDVPAFLGRVAERDAPAVLRTWAEAWQAAAPGSDARRAVALLRPVAELRQAVIYRRFLDRIEASERVFHAADPLLWLRRAAVGRTPRR